MAALNLTQASKAGVAPGLVAANGAGDSFPMIDRNQKFHFKNADVAQRTITIAAQAACNLGFLHNLAVVVPAGAERIVDDIDPAIYADSQGRVQLTYDAATGLTLGSYV
jgi:hypothetical protein